MARSDYPAFTWRRPVLFVRASNSTGRVTLLIGVRPIHGVAEEALIMVRRCHFLESTTNSPVGPVTR